MKISSLSPSIFEYDYDINYYHGKDFLHEGSLLILDPKIAWGKISASTRRNIKKAKNLKNLTIKRVTGSMNDIKQFRTIWFDPEDKTIPKKLKAGEVMYMAYLNQRLVAGMILSPSGNNLFLHNLAGNKEAKENNVTSLLLWHAVEELKNSKYRYIDVGLSFRRSLNEYFKQWKTDSYPIILEPPFIKPLISLTPFNRDDMKNYEKIFPVEKETSDSLFGNNFTIFPRALICLEVLIKSMKINKENNIAVYKTLDNDYISNCVKKVITNSCKLSRRITPKTKAVLVIHEFGYPCKEIIELKKICTKKKIHLIENCAWGFGSSINKEIKIGELGDYVIYSLPKIFPMQYGGVLKGLSIPDKENWEKYQRLDYYKKELILKQLDYFGKKINIFNKRRLKNWNYLNKLFLKDGIDPFCKPDENVFPAVYIAKLKNYQKLYEKYLKFGVEVGRYYQEGALFLPIHQNLSTQHLDYIYGIFRGDLNLCNTYRRIKK